VSAPEPQLLAAVARIVARYPALKLLVLFGSRARGDARPESDWDVGFTGHPELDQEGLLADLVTACGTHRIDFVDLDRAGGLVRYRASRDGVPLHEAVAGEFRRFWWNAVSFWCDAEPVLRRGYDDVLRGLTP
jgi:predicted nucleotidyltransferase